MSDKELTRSQIKALLKNPNVMSVQNNRIRYADEFKRKFVSEYAKGRTPGRIFTDAGFDIDVIGAKRIERASARWRAKYNQNAAERGEDLVEVHAYRQSKSLTRKELEERIKCLEHELRHLKRAVEKIEE